MRRMPERERNTHRFWQCDECGSAHREYAECPVTRPCPRCGGDHVWPDCPEHRAASVAAAEIAGPDGGENDESRINSGRDIHG